MSEAESLHTRWLNAINLKRTKTVQLYADLVDQIKKVVLAKIEQAIQDELNEIYVGCANGLPKSYVPLVVQEEIADWLQTLHMEARFRNNHHACSSSHHCTRIIIRPQPK